MSRRSRRGIFARKRSKSSKKYSSRLTDMEICKKVDKAKAKGLTNLEITEKYGINKDQIKNCNKGI